MTPAIRPLTEADLDAAFALSTAAGWNQTTADWRLFLRDGRAWGIEAGGVLASSAAILPFGRKVAWVSMVLTLPDYRGRGFATALMAHALAALEASGHRAVLDATPLGQPLYEKFGFTPFWTFRRWLVEASGGTAQGVRPLRPADWPALLALDETANGIPRERLLRALATRLPEAARVAVGGGRIAGFALGREGRLAPQIGPVVARDGRSAQRLIAAALGALPPGQSAVIDLNDSQTELVAWLAGRGATPQRRFTRMAVGATPLPGDAALTVAPIGPEFG
jgi:ribosomal protein S18 acetylase RimI-like enzyme